MAYGNLLADVVQSSVTGSPPQFNDGTGTQTGTLCRAWVNYNGSTQVKNGSFNISSVTRNGTGDYTINFTNAMPDTNYAYVFGSTALNVYPALGVNDVTTSYVATTFLRIRYFAATTQSDIASVCLSVFR
jgi:opacity protein-like surface antigen